MNRPDNAVKAVFDRAAEITSPSERQAYLDQACAENPDLRQRVEALLKAYEQAGSFLESPPAELQKTIEISPITEGPGTVIGHYKLLQQIGEGGFGVVFMAEQVEPVRRKVALKIIKPGMDTKQVIARFYAEQQALAMMDHPNIARVFDAGATESGRPYFVMELVRGIPITDYCDQNNLTPRERLELFTSVCHAVQHAHQKGIVHRDIKPSNALITLHDGTPMVKVIDFGISKALDKPLTERTLFTEFGQMIGTPAYMSPEQADMSYLDVDTRTDIYSLGVLLYELLTGATPFDKARLREAAFDEVRRIIREEDPPRPSKRLSTLGETLSEVSSHRKMEPARLSALIRGDLDWIVMKALEKDRTRRYAHAEDFAADIDRHLTDRPVVARPPSVVYRFRKFLRRHKVAVGTTGLIAATLMLALVVGRWMGGTAGPDLQERADLLARAQHCLDKGQYAEAEAAYFKALEWDRRVFGDDSPQSLSTMRCLARLRQKEKRLEEAAEIYENVLDGQNRVLRPTHSESRQTATELSLLYVDQSWELCMAGNENANHAETLAKRAVILADQSGEYVPRMWSSHSLALAQFRNHHAEDALKNLEPALDCPDPFPWFLMAMVLQQLSQTEDARVWYAVASDFTYENDPPELHRLKALAASSLALPDQGDVSAWSADQGIEACTKLVAKYSRVSWLFNRRAAYYAAQGKWEQAASDYAKAVESLPGEAAHKLNLGVICLHSGDLQRYAAVCRSAFQFLSVRDSYNGTRIVLLCSLSPASPMDPRALNERVDRFVPDEGVRSWMRVAKAIAVYRCGRYREAMDSLPDEDYLQNRTLSRLVRAMAHQKLGETREARRVFEIARRDIQQELPTYNAPDRSRDGFMHLTRATTWCMVQTVLREAEQLIDPEHKLAETNAPGDQKQQDH